SISLVGDGDATTMAEIDFGDDSGAWPNDQECDDPRFAGTGMAGELDDANIKGDASDCRQAFEDGSIALAGDAPQAPSMTPISGTVLETLAARIDFGDD